MEERTKKHWFNYTDDKGNRRMEQSNNVRKLKAKAKALRLTWVDIHSEHYSKIHQDYFVWSERYTPIY
jgi:hypothetical protein